MSSITQIILLHSPSDLQWLTPYDLTASMSASSESLASMTDTSASLARSELLGSSSSLYRLDGVTEGTAQDETKDKKS